MSRDSDDGLAAKWPRLPAEYLLCLSRPTEAVGKSYPDQLKPCPTISAR